jgi:hypothetical protein
MDLNDVAHAWHADGFVILPAFIPADELSAAASEVDLLFPSSAGFHDGTDPRAARFIGDEFAGIDTFPFASTAISLLTVNHCILDLAEMLLGDNDIHIYSAEPGRNTPARATTTRTCIATTSTTPSWCRARHQDLASWKCLSS